MSMKNSSDTSGGSVNYYAGTMPCHLVNVSHCFRN
jgi:hypothetical protein